MGRQEDRIFRLNDEIAALRRDEALAEEELIMLRHIDDDARRDAAVSDHPIDRADAKETAGDVHRMEQHVADLRRKRTEMERRRDRMVRRL